MINVQTQVDFFLKKSYRYILNKLDAGIIILMKMFENFFFENIPI